MENLKIKVNSETESKEAQELFFELGGKWFAGGCDIKYTNEPYLYLENGLVLYGYSAEIFLTKKHKEITIQQLKDMVVLKRNDVGDANYKLFISTSQGYLSLYKDSKDVFYAYAAKSKTWDESKSVGVNTKNLEPIEKPMKEYLIKSGDGKYLLTHHDSIGAIEIPEGAIKATFCNGFLIFWKDNYSWSIDGLNYKKWRENYGFDKYMEIYKNDVRILWTRPTKPEELPFIDDEPLQSLNDQYAEIEKVRQDIINSPIHYADSTIECIDAMEAMMTPEQFIGYLRGNVFKYQWRYEKKNGIEDLKKAQWYLDKLTIKVAEKNAPF